MLGSDASHFFGTEKQPKYYADVGKALEGLKETWTRNMVPEADAKAREKAAVLAYRRQLEKEGRLVGGSTPRKNAGATGSSAGSLTWESYNAMSTAERAELRRTDPDAINRMTQQHFAAAA